MIASEPVQSDYVRSRPALALRSRCSNLLAVEISNRRCRRGNTTEVNVDVEAGGQVNRLNQRSISVGNTVLHQRYEMAIPAKLQKKQLQ